MSIKEILTSASAQERKYYKKKYYTELESTANSSQEIGSLRNGPRSRHTSESTCYNNITNKVMGDPDEAPYCSISTPIQVSNDSQHGIPRACTTFKGTSLESCIRCSRLYTKSWAKLYN